MTALLLAVVVAMMLGASLILSPGRLSQAQKARDEARAQAATDAGIEYAKVRLQEDPEWKGDLNRVVVDTPTLYIEEDNGNVVGLLRPDEGQPFDQFRIRFNYHNGASIVSQIFDDGLDDPSSPFLFDLPFVSVNNLEGELRFVPRPDGATNIVTLFTDGPYRIERGRVALTVEGLAGDGLRDTGPNNFQPLHGGRTISRHVVEAVLGNEFADGAPEAALMGGAGLDFVLPENEGEIKIKAKGGTARARTKGNVTVNGDEDGGATVNYKSSGELLFASGGFEEVRESTSTTLGSDGAAPFYELRWDDIHKASPNPSEAVHIPGGTYVFDDTGALHYFDMSWDDYKTAVQTGSGGLPVSPGVLVDQQMVSLRSDTMPIDSVKVENGKLKIEEDVRVQTSTGGVSDFTLVPMRGTQSSSTQTSDLTGAPGTKYPKDFKLEIKPGIRGQTALTSSGNILIATALDSDKGGSIVAEGNLRVDAGKLDKFGNVGVSLYGKEDVEVSTYEPDEGKYLNVGVKGMFYAWGDFHIRTGEVPLSADKWGDIKIEGVVVAYGTDNGPGVDTPGSSGGSLRLTTNKAELSWDAENLGDLLESSRLSSLTRLKRVTYIRRK